MGENTKKKDITLEDVRNMELDPYSCLLDCFMRISNNARKKREEEDKLRASQGVEEPSKEAPTSPSPPLHTSEKEKSPLDDEPMGQENLSEAKGINQGVRKSPDYIPKPPEEIMDFIRMANGLDVKLVIQNQLYTTDLSEAQNHISMPFNKLHVWDFPTKSEEELLTRRTPDGKNLIGINVLVIEPNGEKNFELVFKRWDMSKEDGRNMSSIYVFSEKWHDFCKKYKLENGTIVQMWSFCYDGEKLGFAMVIVDRGANASGSENDHGTSERVDGNDNGNKNGTFQSQNNGD